MHHIQKSVLDVLATASTCHYAQIKPPELDGNVFGYHLKQLLVAKLVEKNADGTYQLTRLGKDAIVHRNEDVTLQPHSVFFMVVRCGEKWLVRERLVQPLLGKVGFVHGEPNTADASVVETAKRRLKEKTGLEVELSIKASGLVRIFQDGELQSFSHAIVLYGETNGQDITPSDATGKNSWAALDNSDIDWLPSCRDIIDYINTGTTWFETSYSI